MSFLAFFLFDMRSKKIEIIGTAADSASIMFQSRVALILIFFDPMPKMKEAYLILLCFATDLVVNFKTQSFLRQFNL